jgi:hypothetical protein
MPSGFSRPGANRKRFGGTRQAISFQWMPFATHGPGCETGWTLTENLARSVAPLRVRSMGAEYIQGVNKQPSHVVAASSLHPRRAADLKQPDPWVLTSLFAAVRGPGLGDVTIGRLRAFKHRWTYPPSLRGQGLLWFSPPPPAPDQSIRGGPNLRVHPIGRFGVRWLGSSGGTRRL